MASAVNAPIVRYWTRFGVAMALYVPTVLAAIWVIGHQRPTGLVLYTVAIAPAVPELAVMAILARYVIEERDELRRLQTVLSLLGGIALVLAVTTVWGFLQAYAGVQGLPLYWVFPLFCLGMAASLPVIFWRYR